MVCIILDQLVEHPGPGGRADPLTSVNSAEKILILKKKIFLALNPSKPVNPHGRLVAAAAFANLHFHTQDMLQDF